MVTSSVTLQKELTEIYNQLIEARSISGRPSIRALELLRQYPEQFLPDLRTIAEEFPTDAGNLTRIRDLHTLENDLAQTKDRLKIFAQNTQEACIEYEQYFDWLKNAHIEFVQQLNEVKNDQLESVLLRDNGLNFYNFVQSPSSIYITSMRRNARLENLNSGWLKLAAEYRNRAVWLKQLVERAASKAIARTGNEIPVITVIREAQRDMKRSLDVLVNYFSNAWSSHIDELKSIYNLPNSENFKSFSPSEINIAPVYYMKMTFLANQQAFYTFRVINGF